MTKEEFVQFENNWDSHRPLLWEALSCVITNSLGDGDVFEFGVGNGSTPYMADFCKNNMMRLISFENNRDWFEMFEPFHEDHHSIGFVDNWNDIQLCEVGLLFIDHAPGERRKVDIARWSNHAKIIVAHDTEPAADHGYQMRAELKKFKYMIDYETDGAWASAVSNFIDVTKWKPWRKGS